jgi:hypothetical protein
VEQAEAQLRPRVRRLTAARRSLPDFVIVGAQKAATTSLMDHLKQHPDVVVEPGVKEVHFFDRTWTRGEIFYRSFFPAVATMERRRQRNGRTTLTGEKTPYYLMHPLVPERAARTVPNARLIAILRDPVARAAAHHRMNFEWGNEPLSLPDAIEAEPERLEAALAAMERGIDDGGGPVRRFSYVARGRYAEQLDRWLGYFPREQLLVIRTEDLAADPEATYDSVLTYLGLAPHRPTFTRQNEAARPYSIEPEARARLEELYREPNRDLALRFGISW